MTRPRRDFDPEFKFQVVLDYLTGRRGRAETVQVPQVGIVALVGREKNMAPQGGRVPKPTPLTSERTEDMRYGNP